MFEFAAAKGLLSRGKATALTILAQRSASNAGDLFVGSVLEQTLILAGDNPLMHEAASTAIEQLVATELASLSSIALAAWAQGVQTGTIRGTVVDPQGLPVPGVSVTATAAVLQGPRQVVTDAIGSYSLLALPPGTYDVRFELNGFGTVTESIAVPLGLAVERNVVLAAATL